MASKREVTLETYFKNMRQFSYKSSNEEFMKVEVNPILEKTVSFV